MVQRANAEMIFQAATELNAVDSLIFIGPVSVSGIAALPTGYLGFKTGVDRTSPEFALLESNWITDLETNGYDILTGSERVVSSHPYVGYAYDAVIAIAKALHTMVDQAEDVFDPALFKFRLRAVTLAGASGNILFDENMEPAVGRYLILNKKAGGVDDYVAV